MSAVKSLGTLCKRGHDHEGTGKSLRYKYGTCVECLRLWRQENREKVNALTKRWREKNLEKGREINREATRRWRARKKEQTR